MARARHRRAGLAVGWDQVRLGPPPPLEPAAGMIPFAAALTSASVQQHAQVASPLATITTQRLTDPGEPMGPLHPAGCFHGAAAPTSAPMLRLKEDP